MTSSLAALVAAASVVLISPLAISALTAGPYAPKIPHGYSSQVVLHVDYGTTPDRIGLRWDDVAYAGDGGDGEYIEGASATNMRVVGDRFYFIDATVNTIKQFRSPGRLVWQSEPFFNLGYYAVAPDGGVCIVWGAGLDQLSRLDSHGKLMWTKTREDLFPRQKLEQFGLRSLGGMGGTLGRLEWTVYGLTIMNLYGTDRYRKERRLFVVVVGDDGRVRMASPGRLVGSDGTIYDFRLSNQRGGLLEGPMVGRNLAGKVVREVRPNFGADNGIHLAGNPAVGRWHADLDGGFIVESSARLPARLKITSRFDTGLEEVLWRFDAQGRFKEQWRFPAGPFSSRAKQVVVGSDGNVYHLRFAETGIDVIKYSRTSK